MSDRLISGIVSVVLAIIGVAIIAAIVSPSAQTGNVITSAANAIGRMICTAVSPITGGGCGNLTPSVTSTINFGLGQIPGNQPV